MYIYYTYLKELEDAQYYGCPQSGIAEGTGNPIPWMNPSECIWRVPNALGDWSTED